MRAKIDWEAHISNWETSGLTKAEYCRRHGINRFSFYPKVREKKPKRVAKRLTEIPFTPFASPAADQKPAFELGLKFPFQFTLKMNLRLGGKG